MESQKINWENLRKLLPSKPDTWNCMELCKFFEFCGYNSVCAKIRTFQIPSSVF